MARYLVLIYGTEADPETVPPEQWQEMMTAHSRFTATVNGMDGAKILGGEALMPTTTATSIRNDLVTDGPFADTKEALGGFYLFEAKDLDQALEIGKLVPILEGGVEVRPIMEF